jgi:hypothetical protein
MAAIAGAPETLETPATGTGRAATLETPGTSWNDNNKEARTGGKTRYLVEKPAESQTSFRLASYLVQAPNS